MEVDILIQPKSSTPSSLSLFMMTRSEAVLQGRPAVGGDGGQIDNITGGEGVAVHACRDARFMIMIMLHSDPPPLPVCITVHASPYCCCQGRSRGGVGRGKGGDVDARRLHHVFPLHQLGRSRFRLRNNGKKGACHVVYGLFSVLICVRATGLWPCLFLCVALSVFALFLYT